VDRSETRPINGGDALRPHPSGEIRVPPPRLYVYFDAIIRHGSMRSAAEALRLSSSALNRRILDLERDVGVMLFDRSVRGVRLTEAGSIFATHVRRVLNDVKQVGAQIQDLRDVMHGSVAIGSAESAAIEILPAQLVAFQQRFPQVRFTVKIGTPQELQRDLLDETVDFILTHQAPQHHDALIVAEAGKSFCALMRQDHPLAHRTKLLIADCLTYPIVLAQEDLAARILVDDALGAAALTILPVLTTNMFEMMKHYVRLTDAISFQFHQPEPRPATLDGIVAKRLADPLLMQARLVLVTRRGRTLSAPAAAICRELATLLRDQTER